MFAHFLILKRIAKVKKYSRFSFKDKDGCCFGGWGFFFLRILDFPLQPLPSLYCLCLVPVKNVILLLAAHHPLEPLVLTEENIGESPEECESNKLQHLYVYLTFNVYKFGWLSHERGFDQLIGQLDLNALLVSGQSGNTVRTACSKQAPK